MMGHSMGCFHAAYVASKLAAKVATIMLICPWYDGTSLENSWAWSHSLYELTQAGLSALSATSCDYGWDVAALLETTIALNPNVKIVIVSNENDSMYAWTLPRFHDNRLRAKWMDLGRKHSANVEYDSMHTREFPRFRGNPSHRKWVHFAEKYPDNVFVSVSDAFDHNAPENIGVAALILRERATRQYHDWVSKIDPSRVAILNEL